MSDIRCLVDPCIEWGGSRNASGYGQVKVPGVGPRVAHRVAYELTFGPIPAGLDIDHLCRNRGCVNPMHMDVVTRSENSRRGMSPRIVAWRCGICMRGHSLSDALVNGRAGRARTCRTCRNERQRARREAQRVALA